ncbi:MAG: hypothetical protein K9J83_05890 [Desulfarculaceae bacterium]|nr:hypothetical protein [Desulfarculaceae bacterium]
MKRPAVVTACLLLFLAAFATGCEKENNKKDEAFQGVGRLISERNKARYDSAGQGSDRSSGDSQPRKESMSTLYEENVEIVSTSTDRTLGKGVAYLDKEGKIVYIKITKKR